MNKDKHIEIFKEKAASVSAIVHEVPTMEAALRLSVATLGQKAPCENLMSPVPGCGSEKILAAPNLPIPIYETLKSLCHGQGINLIRDGVRGYPGGIDMGVTLVDFGIAETGPLVLNSDSEETRLATMLCETHIAILENAQIRETAIKMADELHQMIQSPCSYTAFITGASRTADIERVLAIGVHGPLELHILLITGDLS